MEWFPSSRGTYYCDNLALLIPDTTDNVTVLWDNITCQCGCNCYKWLSRETTIRSCRGYFLPGCQSLLSVQRLPWTLTRSAQWLSATQAQYLCRPDETEIQPVHRCEARRGFLCFKGRPEGRGGGEEGGVGWRWDSQRGRETEYIYISCLWPMLFMLKVRLKFAGVYYFPYYSTHTNIHIQAQWEEAQICLPFSLNIPIH